MALAVASFTLDDPGTRCDLDSNDCSEHALGHGGLDAHHRWPRSLSGPESPGDLAHLCPGHHARQHALVRYYVECDQKGIEPDWDVEKHYTKAERDMAEYALTQWQQAGRPTIPGWSRPAAR